MATQHTQGATSVALAFDPAAWLHAFTSAGGGYVMGADRRLLFGMPAEVPDVPRLLSHLDAIHLHPERRNAIRSLIERHQNGEVS